MNGLTTHHTNQIFLSMYDNALRLELLAYEKQTLLLRGGHVFSLHLSNSRGMNERAFLIDTSGNWLEGDVYFGFNISRVFSW